MTQLLGLAHTHTMVFPPANALCGFVLTITAACPLLATIFFLFSSLYFTAVEAADF